MQLTRFFRKVVRSIWLHTTLFLYMFYPYFFLIETDSLLFKSVLMPKHCLHDLLLPYKALPVKPRDTKLLSPCRLVITVKNNLLSSGICLTLCINMFVFFLFSVAYFLYYCISPVQLAFIRSWVKGLLTYVWTLSDAHRRIQCDICC